MVLYNGGKRLMTEVRPRSQRMRLALRIGGERCMEEVNEAKELIIWAKDDEVKYLTRSPTRAARRGECTTPVCYPANTKHSAYRLLR